MNAAGPSPIRQAGAWLSGALALVWGPAAHLFYLPMAQDQEPPGAPRIRLVLRAAERSGARAAASRTAPAGKPARRRESSPPAGQTPNLPQAYAAALGELLPASVQGSPAHVEPPRPILFLPCAPAPLVRFARQQAETPSRLCLSPYAPRGPPAA